MVEMAAGVWSGAELCPAIQLPVISGAPAGGAEVAVVASEDDSTAQAVLSELHRLHYTALVSLVGVYLGVLSDCEDAVQDAFVEVWHSWGRINDPDKALLYLRRAALNKAKSQLRHRQVVDRHPPGPPGVAPTGEDCALANLTDERVVEALRALPERQRDCVVLRLVLDLSEHQTAKVLKITTGTVKTQLSRARRRLAPILVEWKI